MVLPPPQLLVVLGSLLVLVDRQLRHLLQSLDTLLVLVVLLVLQHLVDLLVL